MFVKSTNYWLEEPTFELIRKFYQLLCTEENCKYLRVLYMFVNRDESVTDQCNNIVVVADTVHQIKQSLLPPWHPTWLKVNILFCERLKDTGP